MGIKNLPEEYSHGMVNHSKEFKSMDGTCTNTIEGSWRHLKRSLPLSVRQSCYDAYLGEFLWRKRNKGNDMFKTFISDIGSVFKPKTRD